MREGGREGWPAVLRRSEEGVRMEVRGGRKERGLLARLLQLTPHPPLWVLRGVLLPPLSCAPGGPARRGLNQTLMRRRPPLPGAQLSPLSRLPGGPSGVRSHAAKLGSRPPWVLPGAHLSPLSCAPGVPAEFGRTRTQMRRCLSSWCYRVRNCRHFPAPLGVQRSAVLRAPNLGLGLPESCQARNGRHGLTRTQRRPRPSWASTALHCLQSLGMHCLLPLLRPATHC